jgi:hypothetical protein
VLLVFQLTDGSCEHREKMEPTYEEHFTAFIDFLGFSEASTKSDHNTRLEVLDLLVSLSLLRGEFDIKSTDHGVGTTHHLKPSISTFSDHIVISYPIKPIHERAGFDEHSTAIFVMYNFEQLLSRIAAAALRIGFLLRGGATIGNLHHARGVVFGEAMVEAFQIESRTSVYPRVVLSAKIASRPNWNTEKNGIVRDDDGLYHVDYFRSLLFQSAPLGESFRPNVKTWFEEVSILISRKLTELETAGRLNEFSKWMWFTRKFRAALEASPKILAYLGASLDEIPWAK